MNTPPEGLTQRAAAEQLGKSAGWINRLVKEGRLALLPNGRIDPAALTSDLLAEPPASAGPARAGNGKTLAQAKTEQAQIAAKMAALDYHARIGTLVSRADAEAHAFDLGRRTRDELLSIAAELAPRLVGLPDARSIETAIRQAITSALGRAGAIQDAADPAAHPAAAPG